MRAATRVTLGCSILALAAPFTAVTTSARTRSTPTPIPTQTPTPVASPTPSVTGTATPSSGYSGTSSAAYADRYWSTYNALYPSFANQGGDCTNFVSQALFAGGIGQRPSPPNTGSAAWYMLQSGGAWSWSTSWINAQSNSVFLGTYLPGVTQVATYVGLAPGQTVASNASPGDIVLYDWTNDGTYDHEAIVTTADGQYVDAHTNSRYHAYWTLAQYNSQWATTRITVLHIPATSS